MVAFIEFPRASLYYEPAAPDLNEIGAHPERLEVFEPAGRRLWDVADGGNTTLHLLHAPLGAFGLRGDAAFNIARSIATPGASRTSPFGGTFWGAWDRFTVDGVLVEPWALAAYVVEHRGLPIAYEHMPRVDNLSAADAVIYEPSRTLHPLLYVPGRTTADVLSVLGLGETSTSGGVVTSDGRVTTTWGVWTPRVYRRTVGGETREMRLAPGPAFVVDHETVTTGDGDVIVPRTRLLREDEFVPPDWFNGWPVGHVDASGRRPMFSGWYAEGDFLPSVATGPAWEPYP